MIAATTKVFEAVAGLRYIEINVSAGLGPIDPACGTTRTDTKQSFNDFVIGARRSWAMSDL